MRFFLNYSNFLDATVNLYEIQSFSPLKLTISEVNIRVQYAKVTRCHLISLKISKSDHDDLDAFQASLSMPHHLLQSVVQLVLVEQKPCRYNQNISRRNWRCVFFCDLFTVFYSTTLARILINYICILLLKCLPPAFTRTSYTVYFDEYHT